LSSARTSDIEDISVVTAKASNVSGLSRSHSSTNEGRVVKEHKNLETFGERNLDDYDKSQSKNDTVPNAGRVADDSTKLDDVDNAEDIERVEINAVDDGIRPHARLPEMSMNSLTKKPSTMSTVLKLTLAHGFHAQVNYTYFTTIRSLVTRIRALSNLCPLPTVPTRPREELDIFMFGPPMKLGS
jgi:hypothetical protein